MKPRSFLTAAIPACFLTIALLATAVPVRSHSHVYRPKLSKIRKGSEWRLVGRPAPTNADNNAVQFVEQTGDGMAWLNGVSFREGEIEVDLKGRDLLQKSFLGVAFHATDDEHCDLIYFRPFNFKSDDPARRGHAVQYVSAPYFTWQKLRAESPGKYENAILDPPDPNAWFHARIVVRGGKVSVYVNHSDKPSLVVDQLQGLQGDRIGLWIGPDSDAAFKDLKITADR